MAPINMIYLPPATTSLIAHPRQELEKRNGLEGVGIGFDVEALHISLVAFFRTTIMNPVLYVLERMS